MRFSANNVQRELCRKLLERGNCFAMTETSIMGGFLSDVFCVSKALYSTDYEVKLTRQDLRGELNSIKNIKKGGFAILGRDDHKRCKKSYKHEQLLSKYPRVKKKHIPNSFVFVVPRELEEECLEVIKDTTYGLTVFEPWPLRDEIRFSFYEIKRPVKIHREKTSEKWMIKFLNPFCHQILFGTHYSKGAPTQLELIPGNE